MKASASRAARADRRKNVAENAAKNIKTTLEKCFFPENVAEIHASKGYFYCFSEAYLI